MLWILLWYLIQNVSPIWPKAAAGIFNHLCLLCPAKKKISHVLQALALTRKGSLELLYFDFIKMVQCVGKTLPFFLFVFLGQGINGWPGTHYVVRVAFKLRASLLLLPPEYWESHHVHSLFQTFKVRIIAVPSFLISWRKCCSLPAPSGVLRCCGSTVA